METNNDYDGGYYYSELTEDRMTTIINCCFTTVQEKEEPLGDYIRRTAEKIGGEEPAELTIEENAEYSANISHPVSILTWTTGKNEDPRAWTAFFFQTETHTYLYAFCTTADDMQETWQAVFEQLFLMDLS